MRHITRLLLLSLAFGTVVSAQEPAYDYSLFVNSRMTGNYFFSATEASAPSSIKNTDQKLPVSETVFHTPGTSLQLEYMNGKKGAWKATITKARLRGQDHFKEAGFFSFYVYAAAHTDTEDLPDYRFLLKDGKTSQAYRFKAGASNTWTRVIVPVDFLNGPAKRLEDIKGIVFSQAGDDGNRHTIYIDDMEFLPANYKDPAKAAPSILTIKGYAMHVDLSWAPIMDNAVHYIKIYRATKGQAFRPVGIQSTRISRYTDFTGETGKAYSYKIAAVDYNGRETGLSASSVAETRPMSDDELLTMVQEAGFRYYWEGAEATSGLARENIPGRQDMIAMGASGFGMMALIVGTERGFITREQSVQRFSQIVDFLTTAETFHGAFSHFVNGPTKKVEPFFGQRDNGGDLVETSFLLQGLLAARAYFARDDAAEKMIRQKITAIWQRVEWDWYRRYPDSKFLYWHWSPDKEWIINHRLIGWNETMITYLLAIASPTHAVPASLYYSGWANQDSTGQKYRSNWGGTTDGSMYTNGKEYFGIKLDVGVSNGGPLFFTHYSYLGYDPHSITDKYTNYFTNNQHIAQINHRYSVENPGHYKGYGDSCWGLTACDGPYHYSASEPVLGKDDGKMGPTGAVSSFPYTPVESMKALKNYYYKMGKFLWGEYGFRDAFNLTQNWCAEIYMGLNQAPMTVMIENYRSGLVWKLFMSDKDIQDGLKRLAKEQPE